jgi:hypothetical protein
MTPIELAAKFVAEECDFDDLLAPEEDILKRIGVTGDDAVEFIDSFAARFEVDMSKFLWYFHHDEEGLNFGGSIFESPDQKVKRIPITLNLLADAITLKTWPVEYPEHEVPASRPDLFINRIVVVGVLGGLLFFAWKSLTA